jgi:hypothetical protein
MFKISCFILFSFLSFNLYAIENITETTDKNIITDFNPKNKISNDNNESENKNIQFIENGNQEDKNDTSEIKYRKYISKTIRKSILDLEYIEIISNGEFFKIKENKEIEEKLIIYDKYLQNINVFPNLDALFMEYYFEFNQLILSEDILYKIKNRSGE